MDQLLTASDAWDVVKLSGRHHGAPVPLKSLGDSYRLVAFLTRHTGAAAYLVNRFAARRYIELLLPLHVPYDHVFDRAWHFGFKFRGVMPLPIKAQVMDDSTIKEPYKKLKKPLKYKLPKLAHRTVNETRRGLHYLLRGLVIPRTSMPPKKQQGR
jgi:glycosyl transferase family 25